MSDREIPQKSTSNIGGDVTNGDNKSKKKKKKKRGGAKRKMNLEQTAAYKSVSEWVFLEKQSNSCCGSNNFVDPFLDGFGVQWYHPKEKLVFEFHCHTTCSDGFLSPAKLVERAHHNGVKVLALTDHDTMFGIPEAMETARRFGIKIIPGVEISTIFHPRNPGAEEPVHILAYYSSCGPSKPAEVEEFLGSIREGRFLRAKNIVSKLNELKLPIKWEKVAKIAGKGVAPGRLHIARALLEAGHVENLKQAFSRYLYDGGPAYSTGSEPVAEDAVEFICSTGGVAVLAHPWALKNPAAVVVRRLKEAGLHGLEAYRSDGKLSEYCDLADKYELLKLGGSDYHGKGGQHEADVGTTSMPISIVNEFLKVARPIWCGAIRDILDSYAKDPSDTNLQRVMKFQKHSKTNVPSGKELIEQCLSSCLSKEERESIDFEIFRSNLSRVSIVEGE